LATFAASDEASFAISLPTLTIPAPIPGISDQLTPAQVWSHC
jgi:hypothetical protein